METVRLWSKTQGWDYLWLDDELFGLLPGAVAEKTARQPVVATDLARLLQLQSALARGYETVIWCDADTLVFEPARLKLSDDAFTVGREVWIEQRKQRAPATPRAFVKVHNAFMMFRRNNVFLDFYCDAATRILLRHPPPYVSQLIGPKLLTALHNIVALPVMETAGVLSPAVARDLLAGGGRCLETLCHKSQELPAALNLCASSVASGDLTDSNMQELCDLLLDQTSSPLARYTP